MITLVALQSAREKARISAGIAFEANLYQTFGANALGIWNLDDGGGTGSAVKDSSVAHSFDGTVQGTISWGTGVNGGKSVIFNAANNYVKLPNLMSRLDLVGGTTNGKIMLCAWVKPTQYLATNYNIFATGFPGIHYFGIDPNRKLVVMTTVVSAVNFWYYSNAIIPLNKWSYVCAQSEAGIGYTIYIDGKVDSKVARSDLEVKNINSAMTAIGRIDTGLHYFIGEIDSVRVYWATP